MVLIDRSFKELSNGGQFVNLDYLNCLDLCFEILDSGCGGGFSSCWSLSRPVFSRDDL